MQLCAEHIVELVDADQRQLGHVRIVRQEAALGLRLRDPVTLESIAIADVQIWSDGGMTCRPGGELLAPTSATQCSASSNRHAEIPHRLTNQA